MDVIVADHFMDKKGDIFKIILGSDFVLDLVLDDVEIRKSVEYAGKIRDPFSLIFSGTEGYCCPQETYRLQHASGWEVDVFLVPIAELPGRKFQYQAIYS